MSIQIAPPLVVTADQRAALTKMSRSGSLPERQVIAAKGLVLAAEGVATIEVARRLGVSSDRVRRWRARFESDGIAGIGQVAPGRGRKPSLPEGTVAEIVRTTLEERPADGSTHWSTRTLGEALGVSRETVRRVWARHGLRPWRAETFKLSNDPRFEEKLVDVVGLYLNPPERAVVFSFDEKTQVQALDRTQPSLPMKRGRAQTMTHDYKRNGTTDLFAALDIATGAVITDFRDAHAGEDVLRFFKQIDKSVPRDLEIHVVLDNLSAHKAPPVSEWLAKPRQQRWHLHFIPTSSSWLNLVERWFRELTDRRLRRGSFISVDHLIDAITLWADHWNADPKPFIWHAEAAAILAKVRRGREALNNNTNSVSDHYRSRSLAMTTHGQEPWVFDLAAPLSAAEHSFINIFQDFQACGLQLRLYGIPRSPFRGGGVCAIGPVVEHATGREVGDLASAMRGFLSG